MTPQNIPVYILLILKILVLMGLGIYSIFSGVLVRQEQLMAHVLEETFEPIIKLLVLAHLIAAVALFLFGFILL